MFSNSCLDNILRYEPSMALLLVNKTRYNYISTHKRSLHLDVFSINCLQMATLCHKQPF